MAIVIPYRVLAGSPIPVDVNEAADQLAVQGLARTAAGTASLYTDAFVTTIGIGGGASNSAVNVGKTTIPLRSLGFFQVGQGLGAAAEGDLSAGDGTRQALYTAASNVLAFSGAAAAVGTSDATTFSLRQGGTDRWRLTTAGHLIGVADNTYDIGAAGATRPRNVYVGTSLVLGTTLTLSADASLLRLNARPIPQVIATSGTIDLTSTGATPLYTVPAAKKCVVTEVRVRVVAAAGSGSDAAVSVLSALGEVIPGTTLVALAATDDSWQLMALGVSVLTLAGDSVDFDIGTGAGATTMDVVVDLIGYLVDV